MFHIIRHTEHRPTKCRFAAGHVFNKLNKAQSHQNLLLVLRLVCSEENCNHLDTSLAYWVSRLLPHDQSLTQRCVFPTICLRFPVYLHYSYPIKAKCPPPPKKKELKSFNHLKKVKEMVFKGIGGLCSQCVPGQGAMIKYDKYMYIQSCWLISNCY